MGSYNDVWYSSTDGLTLYARDYRHSSPKGVILCLHGLTRNSADFEGLCEHLSGDYRVIVVDQRGRGRSDYDNNPDNYNPGVYIQDMLTLLGHLQLPPVIIIGTSLGGLMAMIMATLQPAVIEAVVLNDIGPEINPEGLARIKSYVGKAAAVNNWHEALEQVKRLNARELPGLSEQEWLEFTHAVYREAPDGRPELAYDPAISRPIEEQEDTVAPADLWGPFSALAEKPLLLIKGALSDILASSCVEKMLEIKPDMQFCELVDRGHAPLLTEAESLVAIDYFLQNLPSNSVRESL